MKYVFIVGFSPTVRTMLDSSFGGQCQSGSITWVSEGRGSGSDVAKFKEVFSSRLAGLMPTEVLVLFAIAPRSNWLEPQLQQLLGEARRRHPNCLMSLQVFRDFGAATQVKNRLEAFSLPETSQLSYEKVKMKLGGARVICVVASGRPTILDALLRAGLPQDALDEFFDQEIVDTGRNSTLMEHLQKYVKTYGHMLYAWGSLRTSSKGLVSGFRRKGYFMEAESAGKVAEMLRRLLSSDM